MKAVVVKAFGGADQLTLAIRQDPEPGPGEVLVAIEAAGVGYVDVMAREGRYVFPKPGFIPGLEVAGAVTALGGGVDDAWIGRRVLVLPNGGGGYAEHLATRVANLIPLPDDVPAEAALAIGVNGLVAAFALDRTCIAAGERVLIRGAGGGIGLMAIQLAARLAGAVTATTSTPDRGDRLLRLGATSVWNRRTDPPLAPDSFDVIIDAIGGSQLATYLAMLRPNGRYVLCGGIEGAPPADYGLALLAHFHQSPTFGLFSLNSIPAARSAERIAPLFEALLQGEISAQIDSRFPLDQAAAAHLRLESGDAFGKIVLTP